MGWNLVVHRETGVFGAAPPPGKSVGRVGRGFGMLGVDEEASNGAWSAVEVFVAAPDGAVDIPVMERKGYVADGVGEIPDNKNS
ncbi:hypothetical protein G7Y89_g14752 [Cudoniella acicularis]|uniref:Uncharacterized protein n=1 Tax=Cudoniella acicularis TaxID=354080 RepID=A0A8H4VSV5_9HELO|nr:hypothetical protein G7Y89_g14752 [Cudoniella acicularis]